MPPKDPFLGNSNHDSIDAVVKNLEKRWGLTLVSFLPPEAQSQVIRLQTSIVGFWSGHRVDECPEHLYLSLYSRDQFHCTQFTLTRSDPCGPVLKSRFIKDGHDESELFSMLENIASQIGPIHGVLDRTVIAQDGLGVILLGSCRGAESIEYRRILLSELNRILPGSFNLSSRAWDKDSARFHELHTAVAYLKRPIPQGHDAFVKHVEQIHLDPISFTLDSITLVHHRFRSLAFPQEGIISFPLGRKIDAPKDFAATLNLG